MDEKRWKHAEDETALTAVDDEYSEKLEIPRGTLLSNVFRCKMQRW